MSTTYKPSNSQKAAFRASGIANLYKIRPFAVALRLAALEFAVCLLALIVATRTGVLNYDSAFAAAAVIMVPLAITIAYLAFRISRDVRMATKSVRQVLGGPGLFL